MICILIADSWVYYPLLECTAKLLQNMIANSIESSLIYIFYLGDLK